MIAKVRALAEDKYKRKRKGDERKENQEICTAKNGDTKKKERETETGQINQGRFLLSGALFCKKHKKGREGGKEEKSGEEQKHLWECVQRE